MTTNESDLFGKEIETPTTEKVSTTKHKKSELQEVRDANETLTLRVDAISKAFGGRF